jgi:uncharacterized protein YdiU (UPF0061 family)
VRRRLRAARDARDAGDGRRRHARRAELPAFRALRGTSRTSNQHDALRRLVDFTIATYFPELRDGASSTASSSIPLHAWLAEVVRRTARLLAQWQAVGFAHGVMNTDNMSVLGLTIDYGPFGFLDGFDPTHICNHSDAGGRYAFARQPNIAWWNLHAFAHALRPLVAEPDVSLPPVLDQLRRRLHPRPTRRPCARNSASRRWSPRTRPSSPTSSPCSRRSASTWQSPSARLSRFDRGHGATPAPVRDLFLDRAAADTWGARYLHRLEREPRPEAARQAAMDTVNPKYVLRNHLAQQAIERAADGDFSEVRQLHELLRHPYDEQPALARYAGHPPEWGAGNRGVVFLVKTRTLQGRFRLP